MIDPKLLLNDFGESLRRLSRKGVPKAEADSARQLILEKNRLTSQAETLRAEKNRLSKDIGAALSKKDAAAAGQARARVQALKADLQKQEQALSLAEKQLKTALLNLPNFPHDEAPDGQKNSENTELYRKNFKLNINPPLPHWKLMEGLDIFDQKRAGKLAGSMFAVLKGDGARLLRALVSFAFELNQKPYTEFLVPSVVNSASFQGTGHLPKFAGEAYHMEKDDLWAVPTGEVPLTAMHRGEILPAEDLPLKYMACTPCFRREAGAAGQETRGLLRLHEFHKLELVKLCLPEDSPREHQTLLEDALEPIRRLELPHRVLDLCAGELTFASARTYDIEVYAPGSKQWLEVSSVGLFTDFQSRRLGIRCRRGKELILPHTLNGSGLATPRVLAAILENYAESDGRVRIPEPLKKFMGGRDFLAPP